MAVLVFACVDVVDTIAVHSLDKAEITDEGLCNAALVTKSLNDCMGVDCPNENSPLVTKTTRYLSPSSKPDGGTCLGSVFKWNFLGQFCERVPRVSFVLLVFGARLILPGETESGSAGEHPDKG